MIFLACLRASPPLNTPGQVEKKSLPFAVMRVELAPAPSQGRGGAALAPQVYSARAVVVRLRTRSPAPLGLGRGAHLPVRSAALRRR